MKERRNDGFFRKKRADLVIILGVSLAHVVAIGVFLYIHFNDPFDTPPGVIQVAWISEDPPGPPAPETPKPEVAPKPLPVKAVMKTHVMTVKKIHHKPLPILALPAEATSGDPGHTVPAQPDSGSAGGASGSTRSDSNDSAPSQPSLDADYLSNPAPEYPSLSRRLQEQGVTLLRVLVSEAGKPEIVELKKSSGYDRLDDAALEAVRHWRFVPARLRGKAVSGWVNVPIRFILRD